MRQNTTFTLAVVASTVFGLVLIGAALFTVPAPSVSAQTICPADARQCPDGTWVGRSGPSCEFICPGDPGYIEPSEPNDPGVGGGGYSGGSPGTPGASLPSDPGVISPPGPGGGINGEEFRATPTSGSAPLEVRFSAALTEPQNYRIEFGDGTSDTFEVCARSYPSQCSLSHTYETEGAYTAALVYDRCTNRDDDTACGAPEMIVQSIQIYVGEYIPQTEVKGGDGVVDWFFSFFRPGASEGQPADGGGKYTNYPGIEHPADDTAVEPKRGLFGTIFGGLFGWLGL